MTESSASAPAPAPVDQVEAGALARVAEQSSSSTPAPAAPVPPAPPVPPAAPVPGQLPAPGQPQLDLTRLERYHAWRDRTIATSAARRMVWRVLVGVVGGVIVLGGLALVPLPGPGWAIVVVGLAILATEFSWAERLLEFVKATLRAWTDWLVRQSLWVSGAVGLVGLAFVTFVVLLTLRLLGAPGWVPEWVPLVR